MPHAAVVTPAQWQAPERYPQGVNTAMFGKPDAKGKFGLPDPTLWNVFFDDFQGQTGPLTAGASNGWAQGLSTSNNGQTLANVSADGGTMVITGSAGATDDVEMTRNATLGQNFTFDPNFKFYAETRLSLDSLVLGELSFGMIPASTTTLAASMTEGFRIAKTSAVGTFDFKTFQNSSTAKSTTSTLFGSLKYATVSKFIVMGFAYQGRFFQPNSPLPGTDNLGTAQSASVTYAIVPYVVQPIGYTGSSGGTATHTKLVQYQQTIALPAASLPRSSVALMPCIGYINTSAVSRVITVDYVFVAKERGIQ